MATGLVNGAGTQTRAREPGWWTGAVTLERTFGDHAVAFGADANLYETRSETFTTTAWKNASNPVFSASTWGKTTTFGVFVEDEIFLPGDYSLTAGVRYDAWKAHDGGIGKQVAGRRVDDDYPERTDSAISPKLSFQGPLAAGWDVQLSLGTATRFPTVGELFQGRIDDITQQIDPQSFDPNLKPETSFDASLILRRSFGDVRVTSSVFLQDVHDAIFSFQGLNPFGQVVSSFKNVDRVRQVGIELIAEARDVGVEGLDIDANLSWMDARTLRNASAPAAEGKMFPRIPEWRSNGSIRYRVSDSARVSLGWRYATRPNSDLFGLSRGGAYGFQTEYFTLDGRFTLAISPRAELGVGVDNLLNDQAYVSHPLPQRTFVVDLKSRW
jgi:iron complex outermembrane receptor protein